MSAPDVAIVGGGAIGVSAAYELARAGARVTLFEAASQVGAGCSSGNAGLLTPSHSGPLASREALVQGLRWSLRADAPFALRPRPQLVPWVARFVAACTPARERAAADLQRRLSVEALALHEELAETVPTGVTRRGTLNVYATERGFARGRAEAAHHAAAGLRSETLDAAAARDAEPALAGPVAGAVLYPDELSGDPLAYVESVAEASVAAGATIRTGVRVEELRGRDGRVEGLLTSEGPVVASTVVLAAGVWSPRLARSLRLRLPVQSGKGYHVDWETRAGDPVRPVCLAEDHVFVSPLPGRLRATGMLQLGGLDETIEPGPLDTIQRAAERGVRGIAGRARLSTWAGLRPCSPDGLPIVGHTRRWDGLVVATGHTMLGYTLAPLTARHVAALVAGEQPEGIAALSPERF